MSPRHPFYTLVALLLAPACELPPLPEPVTEQASMELDPWTRTGEWVQVPRPPGMPGEYVCAQHRYSTGDKGYGGVACYVPTRDVSPPPGEE